MAVNSKIGLSIVCIETGTTGLGLTKTAPHIWEVVAEWLSGTTASKADLVYSDTLALAAGTQTLDLYGSLTNEVGVTLNGVDLVLVAVKNKSTTSTENVTVTSEIAWISGNIVIGPSGFNVWASPIDGVAITNTSADGITFDPGSDTFDIDVLILMRSA